MKSFYCSAKINSWTWKLYAPSIVHISSSEFSPRETDLDCKRNHSNSSLWGTLQSIQLSQTIVTIAILQ